MSKIEQLRQLFEEWKTTCQSTLNDFYQDGIINENFYESCPPGLKILLIAKEPNASNHDQTGDRSFVTEWDNKKADYPFARRIAEWTYGILHDFPPFDELPKDDIFEYLRKISFMNVKKSGGKGFAARKEIYDLVHVQKHFISKEIEIIDPDIIILALSFDEKLITEIFRHCAWQSSGYSIQVAKFGRSRVIDFYHPSSRNVAAASYSLLQNVVRSASFRGLALPP